jgi:hypothetical protein
MAGDELRDKVVRLLREVEPDESAKRKRPSRKEPAPAHYQSINGNGNILAGGDVYINKKETIRNHFTPGPEHITAAQARKLQRLVEKAVTIEEAAGGDRQSLFAKWWSILKDQYNVATYREIPAHLGDAAIAWLTQRIALLRPKLRRNDNDAWRKEHYTAIWARARERGMSKGDVYAIVLDRLDVQVASLTNLGERNLKKLYQIMMAL